jgi:hypothetical protein
VTNRDDEHDAPPATAGRRAMPAPELHLPRQTRPPGTASRVLDFSDRPPRVKPRTSALDCVALVFAILLPPLGLLVSIVARIVSRHRHHWVTRVARAATTVSIVLTILVGGGVAAALVSAEARAREAAVVAEAAPLCAAMTPEVLEAKAFGWPLDVTPLPETVESMRAYQVRWHAIAQLAPASAEAGARAIAEQAQILVGAVETSRAIDRAGNLATMTSVTDASGLTAWTEKNCG